MNSRVDDMQTENSDKKFRNRIDPEKLFADDAREVFDPVEFFSKCDRDGVRRCRFFCYDAVCVDGPHGPESSVALFGRLVADSEENRVADEEEDDDDDDGFRKKSATCCVRIESVEKILTFVARPGCENSPQTLEEVRDFALSRNVRPNGPCEFATEKFLFFEESDGVANGTHACVRLKTFDWSVRIPRGSHGATFSQVFGSDASIVEKVVLDANVGGPRWFAIREDAIVVRKARGTQIEFSVNDVGALEDVFRSTATTHPTKEEDDEPWPELSMVDVEIATSSEGRLASVTLGIVPVASIRNTRKNFDANSAACFHVANAPSRIDDRDRRSQVCVRKSECELLETLANAFSVLDPDIVVGHKLTTRIADALGNFSLARVECSDVRTPSWSRIFAGRLLCDTFKSAKETGRRASCELESLAKDVLGWTSSSSNERIFGAATNVVRGGVDFETAQILSDVLETSEMRARASLEFVDKLSLLFLASELAAATGAPWNACACSHRSEKNEYLLARAFSSKGYLLPDRTSRGSKRWNENEKNARKKKKPKYEGGLVLEPKRGRVGTIVAYLDFKSLYPSIIIEHDICFSTVVKTKSDSDPNVVVANARPRDESGPRSESVIPELLSGILAARARVKAEMKTESDPNRLATLEVRQLALKLISNSTYGCIGREDFRFSARHIAALITRLGRDNLRATVELVNSRYGSRGASITGGDTDSLMVDSNECDESKARRFASDAIETINSGKKAMEIELTCLYRAMLWVTKKRYAALEIRRGGDVMIVKGLYNVRRDTCPFARKALDATIEVILREGSDSRVALEKCESIAESAMRELSSASPDDPKLEIAKTLSKPTSEYGEAKGMHHVEAARISEREGRPICTGETVSYVVCLRPNSATSVAVPSWLFASSTRHRDDVASLRVDVDYYSETQLGAPMLDLVSAAFPDRSEKFGRLFEIPSSRNRNASSAERATSKNITADRRVGKRRHETPITVADVFSERRRAIGTRASFSILLSPDGPDRDARRDRFVRPFVATCPSLGCVGCEYRGILDSTRLDPNGRGAKCAKCGGAFSPESIVSDLTKFVAWIRDEAREKSDRVCENPACGNRTKFDGATVRKCTRDGCLFDATPECGDLEVAMQTAHLWSFFDVASCARRLGTSASELREVVESDPDREIYRVARKALEDVADSRHRRPHPEDANSVLSSIGRGYAKAFGAPLGSVARR